MVLQELPLLFHILSASWKKPTKPKATITLTTGEHLHSAAFFQKAATFGIKIETPSVAGTHSFLCYV